VAVDAAGNFYVADTGNNRVQKFDGAGAFLEEWGSIGDGLLRLPSGVALDRDGNIIVADSKNKRVQKFSATGAFIRKWGTTRIAPSGQQPFASPETIAVDSWGSYGFGGGQFDGPSDIAVDAAGTVFVSDYGNNRVQIFKIVELR
jgi:tripartite motif-containing protein 71